MSKILHLLAVVAALTIGCSSNSAKLSDAGEDTDTDADTQSDTDTDVDTDTDTDVDADTDTDTQSDTGTVDYTLETLWLFDDNITAEEWETYRAALPTGSQGRPSGLNSIRHTFADGSRVFAGSGHEVAELSDGVLQFHRYAVPQEKHNLLHAWGTSDDWEDFYLKKETTYHERIVVTLTGMSEADWRDSEKLPWGLLAEWWQKMSWPAWTGGGQVPVQIIVDQVDSTGDNKLLARYRGSTDGVSYTTESEVVLSTTLATTHTIDLVVRPSITDGLFEVYHDGVLKVSANQEIGIDEAPDTGYSDGSILPAAGLYVDDETVAGYRADFEYWDIQKEVY